MVVGDDPVRDEVAAWLDENWDSEMSLLEWRRLLVEAGWGCPTWPLDWYGRGLSRSQAAVVSEEFARRGAVGPAAGVGMALAAPTLLEHGSDELKRKLLRPIITGEHKWCQLFSEPGSGSDLAGLTTRAERDGEQFFVNGQKVWTSGAATAAYGLLLARTDWGVPKHRGITYFAIEMDQPGVEVRPLKQMNGHASFNEVFLTDARVRADHVIGHLNSGWAVALTTLAHERAMSTAALGRVPRGARGRAAEEAAAEAAAYAKTYRWYPQRAGRADLLVRRAQETGQSSDPVVRDAVVTALSVDLVRRWSAQRAAAQPGPQGSTLKLLASEIARRSAQAHTATTGAHAMLSGPDSPEDGVIAEVLVSVPAVSIAGGTDEIQRNIVGERVLGLPKEPQVDRDLPFRQVTRNVRET